MKPAWIQQAVRQGAILVASLAFCLFLACGSQQVHVDPALKSARGEKIAVLGFEMQNLQGGELLTAVSDEFCDALVPFFMKAGFRVIERRKVGLLLKELEIQQSGVIDMKDTGRFGRIAQVRFVVTGSGAVSVAHSGKNFFLKSVSVKMIDASTGETAIAASFEGTAVKPGDAAARIGREIVEQLKR
ncbi:MAG: hypothetical protein JXA20_17015 [Spirochaetes bacterium]|nr:hypothetical protein [Spirochaetota bacterium]